MLRAARGAKVKRSRAARDQLVKVRDRRAGAKTTRVTPRVVALKGRTARGAAEVPKGKADRWLRRAARVLGRSRLDCVSKTIMLRRVATLPPREVKELIVDAAAVIEVVEHQEAKEAASLNNTLLNWDYSAKDRRRMLFCKEVAARCTCLKRRVL